MFSTGFSKRPYRPVGADLFQADKLTIGGRYVHDEANRRFLKFFERV